MKIKQIVFAGMALLKVMTAQTPIGHTTITFNDPSRAGGYGSGGGPGRQIQTEIYYPATSAGNDVPVAGTGLPVISFGHGFSMSWDAYANIWSALVNEGYVLAFPRTEGGLSPSHQEFGTDLAQVITKVQALNTSPSSLFFGKLGGTSSIMGHSMGGGASFIGANINPSVTTIVTMAAANTNPSSVTAAQQISIPCLIISGTNDCVAPPTDHQDRMFDSLIANFKTQINIIGGGHCYFANTNFNCSFGEGTCSPNPSVSREEQQDINTDLITLWLRKFLKNDCASGDAFQDSLANSNRITFRQNNPITCASVGHEALSASSFTFFPNPAKEILYINAGAPSVVEISDLTGRQLLSQNITISEGLINIKDLSSGLYIVTIKTPRETRVLRLIKE